MMDHLISPVLDWQVRGPQVTPLPERQHVEVSLASPPSEEGGEAAGETSHATAGQSGEEEPALAASAPGMLSEGDGGCEPNEVGEDEEEEEEIPRYQETADGLRWNKETKKGIEPTDITNFHARIVADVLEDNGVERTRRWEVKGRVNGREIQFPVPSRAFRTMNWVSEQLGAEALIFPGGSHHDHTRAAIQLLSQPIPQRTVYTHLGWRLHEDRWVYLHTGGAIGAAGLIHTVQVNPPRGLERYCLPDLPSAEVLREANRRVFRFLRLAPRRQTWLLLAAAVAAVLAEFLGIDFCVWLYGPTGSRKSTIVALLLCFFGEFDRHHLPANFTSTANSVELTLFAAKDAPVVIDDYAPPMDAKTAGDQDNVAHRLLRGIGDTRGRNRATADGQLRGEKAPRALPIVTAELPPPGSQSSEARTLQIEWRPESLDLAELTRAQQEDAPYYSMVMTGHLSWLAPQIETLKARLPTEIRAAAQRFPGAHGRVSDAAAKLFLAVCLFLDFAESTGAIGADEKEVLKAEAADALASAAERTGQQQAERRPTVLFLDYVRALLMQGKGYLAARATGDAPVGDPRRWGYAVPGQEGADIRLVRPNLGAEKLGWVDEEEGLIYLPPPLVHPAVSRYSQRAGVRFPVTQRMLGEHLDREGLLARKTEGRREYRVRVEGKPEWCWAIPVEILFPDDGYTENDENE